MKSKVSRVLTLVAFAVLAGLNGLAQNQVLKRQPPNYRVINLGTPLGGSFATGSGIGALGWVSGYANLTGDTSQHAVIWRNGSAKDLGTLGGPDSALGGTYSGFSETSNTDPLGQDFCHYGTFLVCLPIIWKDGSMTPLPTLGGHNAVAYNNNNVGQVVGVAQSSSQDPSCLVGGQQQPPFYPLQQKLPVIWEGWRVKPLPLPSGDLAGEAYAINDLGQVVGSSGECLNFRIHALMWQNGKVVRLGSLGGVLSSSPASINNRGDVTGYSDLSGDATFHAFLWRKGVMIDIGTLPGDYFSYGNEINNQDQVVGTSCDINFNCRPFLWQNGTMNDLNTLIPANSNLYLLEALSINDLGEITGYAFDQTLGSLPAFLAVVASDVVGNAVAARAEAKVTLPDNVRMMVKQQLKTGRFGLHIPSF